MAKLIAPTRVSFDIEVRDKVKLQKLSVIFGAPISEILRLGIGRFLLYHQNKIDKYEEAQAKKTGYSEL